MKTIADCYERIEKTLARTMPRSDSGWEESKHPRGKDGKFGSGGGGSGGDGPDKPPSHPVSRVMPLKEANSFAKLLRSKGINSEAEAASLVKKSYGEGETYNRVMSSFKKMPKETPTSNDKSLVAKVQEIHNSGNADPWSMNADELKVWKNIATKEKNEARNHPNFKDPNSEQRNIYQHNNELLADIRMALTEKK